MELSSLSPTAKVWIYTSNRELSAPEQAFIREELSRFIPQWASHGNQLFGAAEVVENWFVVLAVDESKSMASGCSIDTSVQFIKAIGKELSIDFFNRMNVIITNNDEKRVIHFSEITNFPDWKIYNPLISTLSEYHSNWPQPISESQFINS